MLALVVSFVGDSDDDLLVLTCWSDMCQSACLLWR